MTATRPVTILLAAFVGALLLSTQPAPALAQKGAPSAEDMEAAKKAFLEGKAAKEAGKLDEAVEKFKLSYRLSKRPQLLYNIALTLEEQKNVDLALFYYKKYLADAPKDDAQRPAAEKSVAALEAEVAKRPPPEDTGGGDVEPEPKPKKVKKPKRAYTAEDFQHTLVEDAPPGKPLDITCAIPEDADWVVTFNYRAAGEEKFTPIVMRFRYEEVVARVPAEKVTGNAIQYYIEVHNPAGELITRTGKSTSPNVVYLDAAAKDHYFVDYEETIDKGDEAGSTDGGSTSRDGDDEDPLTKGKKPGRVVDDEDPTRKPGGDPDDEPITRKGNGGSLVLVPDGPGYTDVGSKKFSYVKWGATGTSLGMLTLSMTFYLMASSQSSGLEARALESSTDNCQGGQPCDTYDSELKAIEASGERSESISKVTFTVGLAAGAVAAYWWYKEIKARKKAERSLAAPPSGDGEVSARGLDSVIAVPVAGDDYLGAAAALRF